MKDLPPEMKMIASTQGDVIALKAAIDALIETLSPAQRQQFSEHFARVSEAARTALLPSTMPDEALQSFDLVVQTIRPTT